MAVTVSSRCPLPVADVAMEGHAQSIQLLIPARSALVLAAEMMLNV